MKQKYLVVCAVALMSGGGAGAAESAANVNAEAAAADSAAGALDEIVVTARRKEELLSKVPISITAINQDTLRERQVTSLSDLQNQAPSLSAGAYNSRDALTVSIRGVGQGTTSSPPGVLLYVNEVPVLTDGWGQAVLPGSGIFYDLENVQVLRGPQGTLFGRNSVGGAVLFVTKKPTNDFGGYAEVGYGNYNDREFEGAVNLPIISDKLLVRISGRGQWRDGFTHSQGTPSYPNGVDLDNVDSASGRISVAFKPITGLEDDLVVIDGRSHSRGPSLLLSAINPKGLVPGLFPIYNTLYAQQSALGVRTVLPTDNDDVDNRDFLNLTNSTNYDISDRIKLRNIFGYSYAKGLIREDNDSSTLPLLNGTNLPDHTRAYTEELQIQGTSLNDKLSWVGGGFYLNSPSQGFNHFQFVEFFVPTYQDLERGERSKAAYAQATYELLPGLKATGGFRYTWDTRFGEARNFDATGACPSPPPAGENENCGVARSGEFKAPTWNASLDYQLSRDWLVYAATRRGWRSGGFNFLATEQGAFGTFAPETLTDGELGTKFSGTVGEVPVSMATDVFYQKYKDIQVQQLIFNGQIATQLISNAAAANAVGAEFEGSITPISGLRLGSYFNWLNFRYTDLGPGVDLSFIIDQRPKYKYGLNGEYTIPLADHLGQIRLNGSWGWSSHTGDLNTPGSSIPAQGLLNLGLQWNDLAGLPVDATVFVTNALDSDKLVRTVNIYNSVGFSQGSYTPPRMYGLRLRYRFGEN